VLLHKQLKISEAMDFCVHGMRKELCAFCAERSLKLIDLWVHIFTTIEEQLS